MITKIGKSIKKGFSVIEVLFSITLILVLVTALATALNFSIETVSKSNNESHATFLAQEGIEALRNLREQNFANLNDGTHGLILSAGKWSLSPIPDISTIYTRQIVITSIDANTKRAIITVTWQGRSLSLTNTYTNWAQITNSITKSGLLIFGDRGIASDSIFYKNLNSTGIWGSATAVADIDIASSNKALASLKVFSSHTRNENIIITKHCDGANS